MHITASVFINDDEPGLHQDFEVFLERLAPERPHSQYRHNTYEDNADAHLKRTIMGREVNSQEERITATVRCNGDNSSAPNRFKYDGIQTCAAADLVANGFKGCSYGCLGLGDCVKVCEFDAIHVNEKGIAVVDEEKCVSCKKCVTACPRDII